MIRVYRHILLLSAGLFAASAIAQPTLEESRALAGQLQARLKIELESALQQGGVEAAIEVCRERAIVVAGALARRSGAKVSRTSLRYRNPLNAPEPWQIEGLHQLEEASQGGSETPGEWWQPNPAVPGVQARYLRALPAAPLCLTCHGSELGAEVRAALARDYPFDRAVGYAPGDLRGAISIVWPRAPEPEQPSVEERKP